jgi:hypothetical protein
LSSGGLMPLAVILPYCRFHGRSAPTMSAPARKQSSPLDNKNRK